MKNLIEALTIMATKGDVQFPTNCEHEELYVFPASMDFTKAELKRLEKLHFEINEDADGFISTWFGSC